MDWEQLGAREAEGGRMAPRFLVERHTHTHTHTHTHVERGTQGFRLFSLNLVNYLGFPGGSSVKNPPVMQETQVQSLGQEDPLEKEMATHSSILAWRIQWTEEPGGLQSIVWHRFVHDLATKL